jgi:hypothetical protein
VCCRFFQFLKCIININNNIGVSSKDGDDGAQYGESRVTAEPGRGGTGGG